MFMTDYLSNQFRLCRDVALEGITRQMLYEYGAEQFLVGPNETAEDTFLNAWSHCDSLKEQFYEDCLMFCIVKHGNDFYVIEKKLLGQMLDNG
jgi:hypothetical protein